MIKVLYFVDRLRRGGIQSLLHDMLCVADKSRLQIDVLTLDDGSRYELEDEIREMGINIYKLNGVWLRKPTDIFHYWAEANSFFKRHHDYNAVHMNSSSKNVWILLFAKLYGIDVRIAHSHNTDYQSKNRVKKLCGDLLKPLLKSVTTHKFACSTEAGRWMFGDSKDVRVIANAIITDNFIFHNEWRERLRKEIGVDEDCIVIGCVGRLTTQKNHSFLLRVCHELSNREINYRLLLIGDGELKERLQCQAKEYGIEKNITFLGFRKERNEWYSAMDMFVLPSLHEGLPVCMIEAQAAGLQTIASDSITREAMISDRVTYLSLNDNIEHWADAIINAKSFNRHEAEHCTHDHGFDMKQVVEQLTGIYNGEL